MTKLMFLLTSFYLSLSWILVSNGSSASNMIPKHYVIYMGASNPTLNGYGGGDAKFAKSSYMQLLSSIIDPRVGPVPRRWRGVCMERSNFKKSNCNRLVLLKRIELKTLVALHVNEAGKGGELSHQEMSIISGTFDLTQKTAEDAMTPISKTFSLDINSKLNVQTMSLILSRGHSQIPIYSGDPKNIIGLILVKNLIFCHPEDETQTNDTKDNARVYDIIGQFLKSHCHMAVVLKSIGIQCIENNAASIDPNQSIGTLLLQNC